jgi:hypothetical protein
MQDSKSQINLWDLTIQYSLHMVRQANSDQSVDDIKESQRHNSRIQFRKPWNSILLMVEFEAPNPQKEWSVLSLEEKI